MKKLYIVFSIIVIILLGLIACPKQKKLDTSITKQQTYQTGYITTIITDKLDGSYGYDVKQVNLWSHGHTQIGGTSNFIASCINNEKVTILGYEGPYVHVKKSNRLSGWCLKEWIK